MTDRHETSKYRESGERRHKKRRSRQHANGNATSSEGTGSGHSSRPALSMDALAALNQANTRGIDVGASTRRDKDEQEDLERRRRHQERRERRRRESRAQVDRDEYQEIEPDSPRPRRHRESRERTGRDKYREVETDSPRPRRHRESSGRVVRDIYREVEPDSPKPRKHRESKSYPAPPAYEEDGDAGSGYHSERRQRRKTHSSKAHESTPEMFHDMIAGREDRERRPKERKRTHAATITPAVVEEGRFMGILHNMRGGGTNASTSYDSFEKEEAYYEKPRKKGFWTKKKICIAAIASLVVLIVIIVAAVVVSKKQAAASCTNNLTCNLASIDSSSIPDGAPSYLNPFTWYDTRDFNLTYTDAMVGDLPIMGLNSTWDDSQAPNSLVPALDKPWGSYSDRPARGVNLGGWLSIEPFIAPDLFAYDASLGIIDEYTLCTYLGPTACASTLEKHYSSFLSESDFAEIADAGLDHVRIPYSYWAVQTYDGDPYLFRTSWRYLLRGIEWARKYGLRVNLDLHGLPGSQNGWNHSGRQGPIGWFNGTDSAQNVQRSVDVHDRLTKFFAQPRYANVITHYGLANEPRMTFIAPSEVLNWTTTVYALARANGLPNSTIVVMGDGFRGLAAWQGELTGYGDGLALDVHQYEIFNNEQIVYNHTEKVDYACAGWTEQTEQSMDTATGFGPTIVAEWSQADTDCAQYLNNVGWGNRWTGTYNTGNASDPLEALTPRCPTTNSSCSCVSANADPSAYSDDYKQFLLYFASAQMDSFEKGWGWWYWTWWTTAGSTQWSYKRGLAAGIMPAKAYDRDFHCNSTAIPEWFPALPEVY